MLVLVTGSSKGIGFETVKQLAREHDCHVIAVSRNAKTLNHLVSKSETPNITVVKADIRRAGDRKKIVNAVKRSGKKLDVLIHNAGELLKKPFNKISEKELFSVYNTNVLSPFLLTQTLLPVLSSRKKAHIVNISSMGGVQGSAKFAGLSAYSSSKAALCGLTECLAEELKNKNIAVNCLALGAVQTEMLSKAFPGYKAPLNPAQMAQYICDFALNGHKYFNGKVIPVSLTTP